MARKQSDYLASLLADKDTAQGNAAPPAPMIAAQSDTGSEAEPGPSARSASRASLSLLGRENVLARVASGEVRQVTQLLLDPARVRIWQGNPRNPERLSERSCRDLIDSILAEGGQKVPVVVRHVAGDPAHDYELVAGTRRHFSIAWLRAHSYPDMKLLAQVADLDDEAAFRLADIENRARKDITDIERARNYAAALPVHYDGKATRMAERLNLSKGWLSKMLKAATIPDDVLAAFADPDMLTLNPAYNLAKTLDDREAAEAIASEARAIAAHNANARAQGAAPLPGPVTIRRLMRAAKPVATVGPVAKRDLSFDVNGPRGGAVLQVRSVTRQGVTIHLPMASGAGDEQLAGALKEALAVLRLNGVSVA